MAEQRQVKFSIAKESFSLDELITEVVKSFKSGKYSHKIYKRGKINMLVSGDKNRIRQVIINLLSNAIKYSPDSDKVIISLKKSTNQVTVQVRDFGIGLSKEDYQKVFELFYRTSQVKKGNIKGHGLGLYICREIIISHNGSIWVKSMKGSGTSFYFSLPVHINRKVEKNQTQAISI